MENFVTSLKALEGDKSFDRGTAEVEYFLSLEDLQLLLGALLLLYSLIVVKELQWVFNKTIWFIGQKLQSYICHQTSVFGR